MAHWLMKSEPESYGWPDLVRDGGTEWDGIRNYTARNFLKDMAVGDTVIKYGVDIGKVVQPIRKGEHAHVHNIKTKRW